MWDKRWLEAFRRGFHRAQVNIGAMELSDAEMDADSGDDMSSNDMDIDSDLSLASPPPEAHDGSDCSSSRDWNDTEPPRGMIRGMSLSASSEEEGQDESEGRVPDHNHISSPSPRHTTLPHHNPRTHLIFSPVPSLLHPLGTPNNSPRTCGSLVVGVMIASSVFNSCFCHHPRCI